jgi:hypothetical protein
VIIPLNLARTAASNSPGIHYLIVIL